MKHPGDRLWDSMTRTEGAWFVRLIATASLYADEEWLTLPRISDELLFNQDVLDAAAESGELLAHVFSGPTVQVRGRALKEWLEDRGYPVFDPAEFRE